MVAGVAGRHRLEVVDTKTLSEEALHTKTHREEATKTTNAEGTTRTTKVEVTTRTTKVEATTKVPVTTISRRCNHPTNNKATRARSEVATRTTVVAGRSATADEGEAGADAMRTRMSTLKPSMPQARTRCSP